MEEAADLKRKQNGGQNNDGKDSKMAEEVKPEVGKAGEPLGAAAAGAKRAKVQKFPQELTRVSNPGGGNCLFHAYAQAYSTIEKKKSHVAVRASCVSHLRRHVQKYKEFWDGKSPTADEGPCPSWKD